MPNIVINDYCNLKCKYCFAQTTNSNMDFNYFTKIIDGLPNDFRDRIGIIGGEPTLHPNFREMIEYCDKNKNLELIIFSNGIEFYKYVDLLSDKIKCLININDLSNYSTEIQNNFNTSLTLLKKHLKSVTFGCNIYKNCNNYDYFFDAVKNIDKIHRLSVVAPIEKYDITHMKEYYTLMKPIFINFIKKAKEKKCRFDMDCNRIPRCYFTKEELSLINEVIIGYDDWFCAPVQDITSNCEIKDCFGRGNVTQFKSLDDLIDDLLFYPITYPKNHKLECADCGWNHTCQGGCLAFKS